MGAEAAPPPKSIAIMILYPILLNLQGETCVIVGGGEVARRKIEHLLEAGADVVVIAPKAHRAIGRWARQGKIALRRRRYEPECLADDPKLVFACTDDPETNRAILADAKERKIYANSVDDPTGGDFHVPSMVRRSSFLLTASTGGKAPALAREICHRLEQQFGPAWGDFTDMLGSLRAGWKKRGEERLTHRRMLEILASDAFEVMQSSGEGAARRRVRELVTRAAANRTPPATKTKPKAPKGA